MTLSRQVCGWSLPQEGRLPAAATSTHRSMHLRRPGKRHLSTGKDTLAHGSSSVYLLFFGACPPRSSGDSGFRPNDRPASHLPADANSETQLARAEPFASTTSPRPPLVPEPGRVQECVPASRRADRTWRYVKSANANQCGSTGAQPATRVARPTRSVLDDPAQGYARPRPSVASGPLRPPQLVGDHRRCRTGLLQLVGRKGDGRHCRMASSSISLRDPGEVVPAQVLLPGVRSQRDL